MSQDEHDAPYNLVLGRKTGHSGLQDGTVASYFAMLKGFQGSETTQTPSQQGLGVPKSVFRSSYFAEIGDSV